MNVIITCEHGGNKVPREYKYLFEADISILQTHKAYDPGALELAKVISKKTDYFFFSDISRLLIELNRSINSPNLFSRYSKNLHQNQKEEILNKYYFPFRNKVENLIRDLEKKGENSVHISIHTFTPVLKYKTRNADIGILYDPKRKDEKDFAASFKNEILSNDKNLRIRFNYPYLGISDGFTSYLRKKFLQKHYIGIELEVNQKFILNNDGKWTILKENLTKAFASILL
ncbi:MAG: N-formylglutamate amidohydrolase [Ignavibacteriaceae bacterium]